MQLSRTLTRRIIWLAGWWDGEGSVGLTINRQRGTTATGQFLGLTAQVQASTTDKLAFDEVLNIWRLFGATRPGYTYQEKKPALHKPAFCLRMNRLADIVKLAPVIIPYAVTKKKQWQLIYEWTQSRLKDRELDDLGRVKRGGNTFWPFTEREIDIAVELRLLNSRGPDDPRSKQWFRDIEAIRNGHKGPRSARTERRLRRSQRFVAAR